MPKWPDDTEKRCHSVVKEVHGSDDQASYERLRAVERSEVAEVQTKLAALAHHDAKDKKLEGVLDMLLPATADAFRETMFVRRAGDKVKNDMLRERPTSKVDTDEMASAEPLKVDRAFQSLLDLDAAQLTSEARAIAILCAMDRMETARGLPKQLKVYAVEGPFESLFGVAAPSVSSNAAQPLPGGVWLAYLERTAAKAGHPVPAAAKTLEQRERMAWDGALMGLADQLRTQTDRISDDTEFKDVLQGILRRIDARHQAALSELAQG